MIMETPREIAVVAEYVDGGKFCLAKFMHEEDAREWRERQEPKEWVTYKLYKRLGEGQWEPMEEQDDRDE